jgi:hypothetical protein
MASSNAASVTRRYLKISYGNRLETIFYYPEKTATFDLKSAIRTAFEMAPGQDFRLLDQDDAIFAIAPVDLTIDEIFRLEILPDSNPGI